MRRTAGHRIALKGRRVEGGMDSASTFCTLLDVEAKGSVTVEVNFGLLNSEKGMRTIAFGVPLLPPLPCDLVWGRLVWQLRQSFLVLPKPGTLSKRDFHKPLTIVHTNSVGSNCIAMMDRACFPPGHSSADSRASPATGKEGGLIALLRFYIHNPI